MQAEQQIVARLNTAFSTTELRVQNESARHAGHAGDDGTGESHFSIFIRAPELAAMTRLARHRAINAALGDLTARIHAIAIDAG
jgi:BolA family transcriptional regulator, general stress-responsive regulator